VTSNYLLGILNSSLIRFYLGLVASTSGMGTTRWINNYVKEFPIPAVLPSQRKALEEAVGRIMELKRVDPAETASAPEQEIDQHVYSLYGLTRDEIKLVEEAVK
jgi:adenine-specific DNA-methyltransferase